jgi:hypothetical protein
MTTTTTAVATTIGGSALASTILYFASKNGYGDMPPFVAIELAGLLISAAHVIPQLKFIRGLFANTGNPTSATVPAPVTIQSAS